MPKNIFVLLHFKGHNFCHTLTAGPQFTFMGQASKRVMRVVNVIIVTADRRSLAGKGIDDDDEISSHSGKRVTLRYTPVNYSAGTRN